MVIDIICLSFCLLYAVFGYFSGGLIQILKLGAMVVAYFGAVWLEPILSAFIIEELGIESVMFTYVSIVVGWIAIYFGLAILINLFVKTLYKASETLTSADRMLGALVGLSKAVISIILLVMLFSLVKDRVFQHRPEFLAVYNESYVMRMLVGSRASEYILPADVNNMVDLARKAADPAGKKQLLSDPAFKKLSENQAFQQLAADNDFKQKVNDGEVMDLLSDPRVQKLLNDPEVRAMLKKMGKFKTGAGGDVTLPQAPPPDLDGVGE